MQLLEYIVRRFYAYFGMLKMSQFEKTFTARIIKGRVRESEFLLTNYKDDTELIHNFKHLLLLMIFKLETVEAGSGT